MLEIETSMKIRSRGYSAYFHEECLKIDYADKIVFDQDLLVFIILFGGNSSIGLGSSKVYKISGVKKIRRKD